MSPRRHATRLLARVPYATALARLVRETARVCLRHRVTGLASEAGFFALLSLPPLVLGLVGGLGYVGSWLGQGVVDQVIAQLTTWSQRFLTDESVSAVIVPTMDEVLRSGRADVISVGFVLSLWSGSRVLNVFLDTISIMYGQSGVRGILRTRALSFSLYTAAVLAGVMVLPLVLLGPTLLAGLLPAPGPELAGLLYWPLVGGAAVCVITSLFHLATPRRSPWHRDLPGAILTLVLWVGCSFVLRTWLGVSLGGSTSIYGPLAAPVLVLVWLYLLAIAVLIGAAMNAAVRHLWPVPDRPSARARVVSRVRSEVEQRRPVGPGAARSPWGPVIVGLVPAVGDPRGPGGLDAAARHRLVSVSTHGG